MVNSMEQISIDPFVKSREYLAEYLGVDVKEILKIKFLLAKDLKDDRKEQLEELSDAKLDGVTLAVVPDELWVKGNQPSESHADKQLILFRQTDFEKPDDMAWTSHELAHCQMFSAEPDNYEEEIRRSYPDNKVEEYAFTKQFEYLKKQGKSRLEMERLLNEYYEREEMDFFRKILDKIFESPNK